MKKTVDIISKKRIVELVNGVAAPDNRRALAHRVLPQGDGAATPETRAARAFAFQGRCFVVVRAQADALTMGDLCRRAAPKARREAGFRCFGTSPPVQRTCKVRTTSKREISTRHHHKAPFCRQGAATPATVLHGAHPHETPAATTNRDSRPSVGKATGARLARDGVTGSARSEATYPTVALGLESLRSSLQMEKVITHITLP